MLLFNTPSDTRWYSGRPPCNIATRSSASSTHASRSLYNVEKLLSSELTRQARNKTMSARLSSRHTCCRNECRQTSSIFENRVPKTISIGLSAKRASELTWSWLLEKPWVRKSNGRQSINANAQSSPKRSYIRLSWQSKTMVLIMNKCTCAIQQHK